MAPATAIPDAIRIVFMYLGIAGVLVGFVLMAWETKPIRRIRTRLGLVGDELVPMDQAVRYVWQKSQWAPAHSSDDEWFMTIQHDLRDALRLGAVKAYGRPLLPSGQVPMGFPGAMQSIPAEHWQTYLPQIIDGLAGNKTANKSDTMTRDASAGFYDIHLDGNDLRKKWLPMSFLRRKSHSPLVLR